MTEQPVETEQQFLGNEASPADCPNCSGQIRRTVNLACPVCGRDFSGDPVQAVVGETQEGAVEFVYLPEVPRQHYSPNAHLRRPSWSPVDDVELAALVRKCVNASKLLAIAKAESAKAEEALQAALAVEDGAAEKALEAERYLITFTRKDTGL